PPPCQKSPNPRLLGAAAALSSSHHAAALSSSCDARLAPSSSRGARLSPPRHLPPATPDRHRRRRLLRIDSFGPSPPDLGDCGGYEAWRHHRYPDLPLCPLTQVLKLIRESSSLIPFLIPKSSPGSPP
ncbi:Os03g0180500, partial [Oryza sativa Japonica Group]